MPSAFAFGTYIKGTSPLHTLNAQVKIILACAFSCAIFFVESWPGMLVMLVAAIALYTIARVPIRSAWAGIAPVAFILVFNVLVHAFTGDVTNPVAAGAEGTIGSDASWAIMGTFGVTLDGLIRGAFVALRLALLVAVCSLLTFTTSLVQISDGLLSLMKPLRALHVPVEDVAMTISIAIRFIPTTVNEARSIERAQKSRCATFGEGGLVARVRAWIPVLIPLVVRLFRRARKLADALDARCYNGVHRTHIRESRVAAKDIAVGIASGAVLVCICVFF